VLRSCAFTALLCSLLIACVGQPAPSGTVPPAPDAKPQVVLPATGTPLHQWTDAERQGGFRNVARLWPSYVVKRGESVHPMPQAPAQIEPRLSFDGAEMSVEEFMQANGVTGLIAVKDGQVVLERYGFGRKPEEPWISFSVSKSITSLLVGAAIADGHIRSVNDKVTRYLPELKGSAYDGVSIRHLLTMRSGVAWNETYADPEADVWKAGMGLPIGGLSPLVQYMKGLKRAARPGTRYLYNTGETDLVGLVVSSATGKPLHEYLSEKIWAPFGMESDATWPMDRGGHAKGGCCLNMTLRDYARVGLFALGGGQAGGKAVVPATWLAESTRAYTEEPRYGYFWWLLGRGGYAAMGIYGQGIYVLPQHRLVIAVNSSWPAAWDETHFARGEAMFRAIIDAAR
jgi:CubicO group peptidase (beta-lactamase class C family)